MNKENSEILKVRAFIEDNGYDIYDIEVKKQNELNHIIIYLNEVSKLDEIIDISRKINHYLDENDIQNKEYMLEVSSKGLRRKLTSLNHFQKSIGDTIEFEVAKIKTQGIIKQVQDDTITIEVDNVMCEYLISDLKKCKTVLIDK